MAWLAAFVGWVALGSALGGLARYVVSGLVARAIGETFPWGTFSVNLTGAFAIGVVAALAQGEGAFARPEAWLVLVTGFLGSYTTVSSFSLQTLALLRDSDWARAGANVGLSLMLCPAAAAGGIACGRLLAGAG